MFSCTSPFHIVFIQSCMAMKPTMSIVVLFIELLASATINVCFCNSNTHLNCIESERQALLRFKRDLEDPSNWLASWSGDGDCCTWAGVVCDNLTGHVLQLHLEAFGNSTLGGKINPSLLDLKELIYLNFSYNDFGGTQIPRYLGSMQKLRSLDLSFANFSGLIPHQLGNLSDLRHLGLGGNWLSTENIFWLSGLSLLEHLDLTGVNLRKASEWLKVINNLSVLRVLILSNCRLLNFPPIPIANFSSLTILDLSWNQMGNRIPSWIFDLHDLVFLSLYANDFQGPVPDGLQNLTSLRHFDLARNRFNSSIPNWLYKFNQLEYLDLSSFSNLEVKLPRSFGTLCNLKSVHLSHLKLNQSISEILDIFSGCVSAALEELLLDHGQVFGHLTDKLGKLKNLVYLELTGNSISGSIPVSLGKHSSLEVLYLSNNRLDGTISEIHFANLTKLKYFSASQNSIKLTFSPDWLPPFQLRSLRLDSCLVGPKFPSWLYSQKNLYRLTMSNSGIFDTISYSFFNSFRRLTHLNLSHNSLHGELPNLTNVCSFKEVYLNSNNLSGPLPLVSSQLWDLDLSNNGFSGSISLFLCYNKNESKSMQLLFLKDNALTGKLPNCWKNWNKLQYLNLGNNNFTGYIPASMGYLTSLHIVHLHKNNFSGTLPPSLKSINGLWVLDLSENKFSAKIPTWIGESFSSMKILNLRSNKFHGVLPTELCHISSLQIMDLAENNLSGTLPRCVNKFSAMMTLEDSSSTSIAYFSTSKLVIFVEGERLVMKGQMDEYSSILNLVRTIDLSKNNFSGEIPIEMTNLKALQSLNLSYNFLTGRIPGTIGAMTSIESLDLSENQLSGEIPSSLANLTFLSHLNLSNNMLTGRIPLSSQLQSLDASCFGGNDLCGDPLPKKCTTVVSVPNQGKRDDGDEHEVNWFYASMPIGFAVGFWGVIGPLVVNRRWRYKYYQFLNHLGNKLYFFVRKCC